MRYSVPASPVTLRPTTTAVWLSVNGIRETGHRSSSASASHVASVSASRHRIRPDEVRCPRSGTVTAGRRAKCSAVTVVPRPRSAGRSRIFRSARARTGSRLRHAQYCSKSRGGRCARSCPHERWSCPVDQVKRASPSCGQAALFSWRGSIEATAAWQTLFSGRRLPS